MVHLESEGCGHGLKLLPRPRVFRWHRVVLRVAVTDGVVEVRFGRTVMLCGITPQRLSVEEVGPLPARSRNRRCPVVFSMASEPVDAPTSGRQKRSLTTIGVPCGRKPAR